MLPKASRVSIFESTRVSTAGLVNTSILKAPGCGCGNTGATPLLMPSTIGCPVVEKIQRPPVGDAMCCASVVQWQTYRMIAPESRRPDLAAARNAANLR